MATFEEEMVRHSAAYYEQHADKVVAALRGLADRVERELTPDDNKSLSGTPRYASAVERAQNAIAWDLAEVHLSYLVGDAARADAAEAALAAAELAAAAKQTGRGRRH